MKNTEYASPTPLTYKRLRAVSQGFSVVVILVGITVIIGWFTHADLLKRIWNTNVAMNPVTAMSLICAGSGLFLKQEKFQSRFLPVANFMAIFIIGTGILKVFLLVTSISFPFDQILFKHQLWEPHNHVNNAIAPNTALNLILIGFAILFLDFESAAGRRPSQYIAIVSSLLALVSLYGYVYRISSLYTITSFLPMALHTAICFLLLSAGVLFSRPDRGSMAIVIGESSSQIIFMRFIAMVLPLIFGWLKLQGEQAGYYSKEAGTAMFAVLTYIMAMYLLGRRSVLQHKIRETKRMAMEAIQENERKLQAILDNTTTNISLKTLLGKYTLVNKQFQKDFNQESGSSIGKTDYDLFPKELARELNISDHQVIKTGLPKSFEEKYPQSDGLHTYLTVKFPLFNQHQKMYAIGAVSTDISKRKHLEEELRKSHQRLFAILDNLGEGVIVVDAEGNLLIFNRRAEEILGTSAVNVPLEKWNETYGFYHPDGQTYFSLEANPLFKAVKGETADNVELIVKNERFKGGKWIAVTGRPVQNEKEEVIAGVIVFRDISIRKNLELLFKENEKRLKVILASIGEGIIILNTNAEILVYNRKAEELLGVPSPSLPVAEWPEMYGIFYPDGETLFPASDLPFSNALIGLSTEEIEVVIRNNTYPEGRHILLSGKPMKDNAGNLTGAIMDLKDITDQRQVEDYLRDIEGQFLNLIGQHRPSV